GTVTSPKRARALSRSTLSGSASSAGAVLRASSEDEEPPRAIREDSESRRRVAHLGQDRVAQLGLAHDRAQGTALLPRHVAAWSRARISATGGACPRSSLGLGAASGGARRSPRAACRRASASPRWDPSRSPR